MAENNHPTGLQRHFANRNSCLTLRLGIVMSVKLFTLVPLVCPPFFRDAGYSGHLIFRRLYDPGFPQGLNISEPLAVNEPLSRSGASRGVLTGGFWRWMMIELLVLA